MVLCLGVIWRCNGAAVSRTTYSALFAIVGTTYGSGNGSSTFNLPDLKNNIGLGRSNAKALASTGGANTVQTTGNVAGSTASHTITTPELPSPSHSNSCAFACMTVGCQAQAAGQFSPGNTGSAGGGGGHSPQRVSNFYRRLNISTTTIFNVVVYYKNLKLLWQITKQQNTHLMDKIAE